MITDREEFIKTCGILAYSDTHPADGNYIIKFIVGLGKENEQLQKKLDKAIELLIASEYKQFLINEKGKETIKECWLRYIEQELEK